MKHLFYNVSFDMFLCLCDITHLLLSGHDVTTVSFGRALCHTFNHPQLSLFIFIADKLQFFHAAL